MAQGARILSGYSGFQRYRDKAFSLAVGRSFASFGSHSVVAMPARIEGARFTRLGHRVYLGAGCWLQGVQRDGEPDPEIVIGDGTSSSGGLVLSSAASIRVGKEVLFARNVYVADHAHEFSHEGIPVKDQGIKDVAPVSIGDGAWLGQNVVVLAGVTIGPGSVVGANSVVTRDVPARSVAVGAPAQVIRRL